MKNQLNPDTIAKRNAQAMKEAVMNSTLPEYQSMKMPTNNYVCNHCQRGFKRPGDLKNHLNKSCPVLRKQQDDQIAQLKQEVQRLSERQNSVTEQNQRQNQEICSKLSQIDQKIDQKIIQHGSEKGITNNLQIICVGSKDNYLDMLSDEIGFDKAIEFIRGCALSDHNGDVRLIERVYKTNRKANECPIRVIDFKKRIIEFFNENGKWVTDYNGRELSRRLCNNIQNTYLAGVHYLIQKNPENRKDPMKFLDESDTAHWNRHIYNLGDSKIQNRVMKSIEERLHSLS